MYYGLNPTYGGSVLNHPSTYNIAKYVDETSLAMYVRMYT